MSKLYEISLEDLYDKYEGDYESDVELKYGTIRFEDTRDGTHFDFFNKDNTSGRAECLNKENVELLDIDGDKVTLRSEFNMDSSFSLTRSDCYAALSRWASRKDLSEILGEDFIKEMEWLEEEGEREFLSEIFNASEKAFDKEL